MQLFEINRGMFITTNQQYRIQYMTFNGGKSEWIISRKNSNDNYFSVIDSASTLADAKAKFSLIAKAVA